MGWFTRKVVTWRRGIQNHVDSQAAFNQLAATLGRANAKKFLETVYDKWVNGQEWKIEDCTAAFCRTLMEGEHNKYLTRKHYIDSLMTQMISGSLRNELNANLRPPAQYYNNPLRGGLVGRDLAIDQAANWVCGTYASTLPATRALLQHYIPVSTAQGGPMGQGLGRTTKHLQDVHKRVAPPNLPKYRLSLQGATKYPSTIGGHVLLEYIFSLNSGRAVWPPFGDAEWESIAMFYMVSIVHAQGFSDCNKRAAHVAYAILLIKGTHNFKAPTPVKESELFRLNV